MLYSSFLLLLSQLAFGDHGKVSLNGQDIFVRTRESHWELSSKLELHDVPSDLKSSISSTGRLPMQADNIYLHKDPEDGTLTLIHNIPPPKKFTQYRQHMEDFLESLSVWMDPSFN